MSEEMSQGMKSGKDSLHPIEVLKSHSPENGLINNVPSETNPMHGVTLFRVEQHPQTFPLSASFVNVNLLPLFQV